MCTSGHASNMSNDTELSSKKHTVNIIYANVDTILKDVVTEVFSYRAVYNVYSYLQLYQLLGLLIQ